jgi:ABC-type methionine transport system ATPase subunit
VYENVAFAMEVTGKHNSVIRNQVPQVLKLVGLSAKAERLPRQLSGGEQQRVAVARAFVNRPLILLADEPTGNLDPATSVGIMRILDRINRTGTTVVMATHDHAIVDAMQRRVVQLDRGHIARDESRGIYETRIAVPVEQTIDEVVAAVPDLPAPAAGVAAEGVSASVGAEATFESHEDITEEIDVVETSEAEPVERSHDHLEIPDDPGTEEAAS